VHQKRLIREREMKEGTWTDKKPPRKTPSSQEMGVVGGSGVVNRPYSDWSTPSLEKEQPKKPRNTQVQTESYKEAVAGIKMAVIHKRYPDVKLDQAQADLIQVKLLSAVDVNPSGEAPLQFLYSKFA
jgi:regulation of enolase protein 1 (concanavalin A-like superfamily)